MHIKVICRVAAVMTVILCLQTIATSQSMPRPSLPEAASPDQGPRSEDETRTKMEADMAKRANQDRQVQLKRDTEKLLKLATELKEYVDKTNEHVLSLDVVKKAEEIEKLAHSVKDKMKGPN